MIELTPFFEKLLSLCDNEEDFIEVYKLYHNNLHSIFFSIKGELKMIANSLFRDNVDDNDIIEERARIIWENRNAKTTEKSN